MYETTMSPAAAPAPITARVADAVKQTGLSKATIYREAAAGRIKILKYGRTALVDMDSVRSLLSSLPTKTVRGQAA